MATAESVQPTTTVEDKTAEVALALVDHIEDQIKCTDTKAQVVLAADAILLGWFSTQNPTAVRGVFAGYAPAAHVQRRCSLYPSSSAYSCPWQAA